MLSVALVLILAVHLLSANLATAGPIVAIWLLARHARTGEAATGQAARQLVLASIAALVVTIALGLVTLGITWLVDPEPFFGAAARFPVRRYWFGVAELLFYFVALGYYLSLERKWPRPLSTGRWWTLVGLLLLAGTDLAYHFPPLFAMIGVLGSRSLAHEPVSFFWMLFDPEVLALTIHFLLASFAATGATLMYFGWRRARNEDQRQDAAQLAIWGARIALVPTVLQLLAGTFVLVQLPDLARERLLGQDLLATGLFGLALVGSVALMHRLAAVALGDVSRKEIAGSLALLVLIVLLMIAAQQRSRAALAFNDRPFPAAPVRALEQIVS